MFEIVGEKKRRLYDAIKGKFYENEKGIDLLTFKSVAPYIHSFIRTNQVSLEYLRNHTQVRNCCDYEDKHKPIIDNVTLIDVTLGMKCNYRCKYCLQNLRRDRIEFNEIEFLKQIRESEIQINNLKTVRIWGGGEPFVYWDRFKSLVCLFRQTLMYNGKIWTVSNGSCFDDEKCNFCLKNNVAVMFSHDGLAQKELRNKIDYLDNTEIRNAVIKQISAGAIYKDYRNNFSISGGILMVLGPYNIEIEDSIKYLEDRLYKNFPSKIATVFKADKRSESILTAYGKDGKDRLKQNILTGLRLEEGQEFYSYFYNLRRLRDTVIRHLVYSLPYASFKAKCPSYSSSERLAFDTEGRILVCYADSPLSLHNHGKIEKISECFWNLKSIHQRKICKECPYIASCMGGCPMLDDENHAIWCKSQEPINQALFESAYEIIFNEKILRIETI